jgi:hypothetical protein
MPVRSNVGEAKGKRRAHGALLQRHPWCIYCGDQATTIEHMPPRMMFLGKQRPQGLEFPSCAPCNHKTSDADLVASLIGRFDPDAGTEVRQTELLKLLSAVENNIPGLLKEMHVGRGGQKIASRRIPRFPSGGSVMRVDGPLVTKHMRLFGAKLGFALHFEEFGRPVPDEGGVTNAQAAKGELPDELIRMFPPQQTLRQGRKEVSAQFGYSSLLTTERRHSVYYATFRTAFAVAAVTALDRSELLAKYAVKFPVFKPGDFRAVS